MILRDPLWARELGRSNTEGRWLAFSHPTLGQSYRLSGVDQQFHNTSNVLSILVVVNRECLTCIWA